MTTTQYAAALERLVARGRGGSLKNMPSSAGLDRTRTFLKKLVGEDQLESLGDRVVHVVGTNGKGSVAWKTAHALAGSGIYRNVGLYTSPHLFTVRERIRINGAMITVDDFVKGAEEVLSKSDESLSYFELVTCMAFAHFARRGCEAIILEAGMGGRGDATNVLPRTKVAVLTSVALDHVAVLGPTIQHICREKIGVAKEGTRVVVGPGVPSELDPIIHETCLTNRAASITRVLPSITMDGFDDENSQVARACIEQFTAGEASGKWAIDSSRPRCRLESIQDRLSGKELILDVGHNPAALQYSLRTLMKRTDLPKKRLGLVFAIAADKDAKGSIDCLLSSVAWSRIEFVRLDKRGRTFKDTKLLKQLACEGHSKVVSPDVVGVGQDAEKGVQSLLGRSDIDVVFCCGSHALMADVLKATDNEVADVDPFDTNERGASDPPRINE